jgi:hypothetical protein
MAKRISQREAHRLRKRLEELDSLENRRANAWASEWPMGANIGRVKVSADSYIAGAIRTSRLLRHAVVVTCDESGTINFHALPLRGK